MWGRPFTLPENNLLINFPLWRRIRAYITKQKAFYQHQIRWKNLLDGDVTSRFRNLKRRLLNVCRSLCNVLHHFCHCLSLFFRTPNWEERFKIKCTRSRRKRLKLTYHSRRRWTTHSRCLHGSVSLRGEPNQYNWSAFCRICNVTSDQSMNMLFNANAVLNYSPMFKI